MCLSEKQQIPILVFRLGLEPTIYSTRGKHANHYNTYVIVYTFITILPYIANHGVFFFTNMLQMLFMLLKNNCGKFFLWEAENFFTQYKSLHFMINGINKWLRYPLNYEVYSLLKFKKWKYTQTWFYEDNKKAEIGNRKYWIYYKKGIVTVNSGIKKSGIPL